MDVEQMAARLREMIARRMDECEAKGNLTQRDKWAVELKHLTLPAYCQALTAVGFDPARLGTLAIYATTKLRRLVAHYLGVGRADPYTFEIIRNARVIAEQGNPMANRLMTATLSAKLRVEGITLPTRREGSEGTASTQASSTRMALAALGAGKAEGKGPGARFEIDFAHPIMRTVIT
jgi:hypothetical protein